MESVEDGTLAWSPPDWLDIVRWPLPHKGASDRFVVKGVALVTKGQVRSICGLEHLAPEADPFILVANHSTKRDAIIMPTLLMLHRGGRPIHFLADWNPMLIPGVSRIYRCGGAIIVTRKPARPRILDRLRPLFAEPTAPNERARMHLAAGRPVGIYPEGTVNRNPNRLLRGRNGAARLSLETGVPIVPVGLRFPETARGEPVTGPMEIIIGAPRHPPAIEAALAPLTAVREWHATIMSEIARLSGKTWRPRHEP